VQKATFNLVVTVSADDAPETKAGQEELTTEVFVPLVHFASDPWVKEFDAHTESVPGGWPPDDQPAPYVDEGGGGPRAPDSLSSSFLASSLTLGASGSSSSSTHYSPNIPTEAYSIGVELSQGSWRIDSQKQTLYWKYQIPAPGEPAVEHSIRIWRVGGAIKSIADGTVTQNVDKQRMDAAAAAGMWDCCPADGCIVM